MPQPVAETGRLGKWTSRWQVKYLMYSAIWTYGHLFPQLIVLAKFNIENIGICKLPFLGWFFFNYKGDQTFNWNEIV